MEPVRINTNKIKSKTRKIAQQLPLKENTTIGELRSLVNSKAPIKIDSIFLEKIYKKYPLISKSDIALIMKTSLEVIREHMISGYKISIKELFGDMHFILNTTKSNIWFLKVKNTTNPKVRKS